MRRPPRSSARPRAVTRSTDRAQTLTALAVNSTTSLVAGLTLGALTGTFDRLPGLLVLVPAAIGLRGNVFSALGSRLSTAVHTGTFSLSRHRDTVMAENVIGALVLTTGLSLALAIGAWLLATVALAVTPIPLVDLALISIVGGLLASTVVLGVTVGLAVLAAQRGWDLDNLVAPVVATLGDVLTLPALWLAYLVIARPRWYMRVAHLALATVVAAPRYSELLESVKPGTAAPGGTVGCSNSSTGRRRDRRAWCICRTSGGVRRRAKTRTQPGRFSACATERTPRRS